MLKRIVTLGIFVAIIAIGFFQKDVLIGLIQAGGFLSILISMVLVAICVFFPVVPFPVLAGIIGAVFGVTSGAFISLIGAMVGTMCFFFLSRYGFREWAQEKLLKYPKVQEYEQFLNRNSFTAILLCRLVPIIPAPVVNMVCGLSTVKPWVFLIASTIGKIPNILILSFAGAAFSSNKLFSFGLYGAYILIIFLINFVYVYRRMSKEKV